MGYEYQLSQIPQQDGYAYDNQGNVYQVDQQTGQPVQIASGFNNSGALAQPEPQPTPAPQQQQVQAFPVAQTGGGGGTQKRSAAAGAGQGALGGAATGAQVGTAIAPGYGTAIGAGVGAVAGAAAGGLSGESKSDKERMEERIAHKKLEGQRAIWDNRGGNDVIGSIAKPGGPVIDTIRATMIKGEPLTPDEQKAINIGGYSTGSQMAAREMEIYNNKLKGIQAMQNLGNLVGGAATIAAGTFALSFFKK